MGHIMYRYILRRIKKSQTTQRCEINCCNDRERTERRAKKFPLIKNWEFSLRESCVNEGHETIGKIIFEGALLDSLHVF